MLFIKALFNNVSTLKNLSCVILPPYMLSVSLIMFKNEALQIIFYFKSIIKCFKKVKIDK